MTKEEVLAAMRELSLEERGWVFGELLAQPLRDFSAGLQAATAVDEQQTEPRPLRAVPPADRAEE